MKGTIMPMFVAIAGLIISLHGVYYYYRALNNR